MKIYPRPEDFIIPGKTVKVSEETEKMIYRDLAEKESEIIQREAEAIQESRKIILDL